MSNCRLVKKFNRGHGGYWGLPLAALDASLFLETDIQANVGTVTLLVLARVPLRFRQVAQYGNGMC